MIIDNIKNIEFYSAIVQHLDEVSGFLKNNNLKEIQPGKYTLSEDIFYYCFEYTTKENVPAGECHQTYCDLHILVCGEENVGVNTSLQQSEIGHYDSVNDYSLVKATFNYMTLKEGHFAIFFPHEGHATGLATNGSPMDIKKLVFKIPKKLKLFNSVEKID